MTTTSFQPRVSVLVPTFDQAHLSPARRHGGRRRAVPRRCAHPLPRAGRERGAAPEAVLAVSGVRWRYNREVEGPVPGEGLQLVQAMHQRPACC
jgi:hypothetical protein